MKNSRLFWFVMGLLIFSMLAVSLTLAESSTHVVDDSADTGRYTSIAIYNGRPFISYYDVSHQALRLAECDDAACQQPTITTIDDRRDMGQYSSLALRDDKPMISYYDASWGDLRLSTCLNRWCGKMVQVRVDSAGDVGQYTSLALYNKVPNISYYDATNGDLKLALCWRARCKNPRIVRLDQTSDVGQYTSLRIVNNQPIVSYYDATNGDLKLAVCNNMLCMVPTITVVDAGGDVGRYTSLTLRNGLPVISYYDATNGDLKLAMCNDLTCAAPAITTLDHTGDVGRYSSIAIYDNRPVISYYDAAQQSVKLALCDDATCTTATILVLDSVGNVGLDTDLVVNNHEAFISYHDATLQALKLASNVLAIGCYANAPDNVNEGEQFTVEIACNQVMQPVFGFQIGHQITRGAAIVTANADHFTPGDAFAGQTTLSGPNTLDIYALSLVAGSTQAQGAFTLGSVLYTADEPGEVVFDLANPILGTIQGEAIGNILAARTSATVTINDVFCARVRGEIRPENGMESIELVLDDDPLVENVQLNIDPTTGIVEFVYENIQEPSQALNAFAESHTGCVQLLALQDNDQLDLGDQLLLLAGDVTDDNAINVQDTAVISALYGQPPEDNEDINHDGVIDILDLIYVSRNYDTIGPTICAQ